MNVLLNFMRATALVASCGVGTAANDGETLIPLSKSLMSDQTRDLFSANFWIFVSTLEVPPTVVFSQADFTYANPVERTIERQQNFQNLQGSGINIPELSKNIYDQFENHSAHDHNAGAIGHDRFIPLLKEYGDKLGIDVSTLSEDVRIDVVSVMSGNDLRKLFSGLSGLPEVSLDVQDVPIEDLRAFVMFHEIGHLVHASPDMSTLESEWLAETYAHAVYQQAYVAGIVTTADLPMLFSQARSMNAFSKEQLFSVMDFSGVLYNFAPDYEMTAIAASYGLDENPDFQTLNDNLAGAYRDIFLEVGKNITADGQLEYKVHVAGMTSIYQTMIENEELSPEQTNNIRQLFQDLNTQEMEILDQNISYYRGERVALPERVDYAKALAEFKKLLILPTQYQDLYNVGREEYMQDRATEFLLQEGLNISRRQPELIYVAARSLLERGSFDNNRAGVALAENFVRGAEILAPDYFGVGGVNGPTYSSLHPLPETRSELKASPKSRGIQYAPP